ncbi:MAG: hypothetical protein Q7L19_14245 [Pseudohongiella sp.]|nr:hypothetical protein [Pseudohongiella sp.]
MTDNTSSENTRTVAVAVSLVSAAGLGLLLWFVLPPEPESGPFTPQYEYHKTDELEFILEPFQSLEYKYLMDRGSTMVFSWRADGDLYFDMHAENTTVRDQEESYAQGVGSQQMGAYKAAFNGMHGWFWENRGFEEITLRLKTSGFYVNATEYRGGGSSDRSPSSVF